MREKEVLGAVHHGGRGSPCSRLDTKEPRERVSSTRRCRDCSSTLYSSDVRGAMAAQVERGDAEDKTVVGGERDKRNVGQALTNYDPVFVTSHDRPHHNLSSNSLAKFVGAYFMVELIELLVPKPGPGSNRASSNSALTRGPTRNHGHRENSIYRSRPHTSCNST